ncbi:hypothetical protein KRR26_34295 [Corallococcus sp. M34]|uniref:hypothetical protein n=1 Tax=Citreicoccus inhibens TaxID=2849499 RepID=UPI001C214CFB|nr:hypothetical protein [Citreicoccus inhibens]MBU8900692.1 hypothetical protein [Citreicoccus inhibens]
MAAANLGACSAITEAWIRASNPTDTTHNASSERFGKRLNTDLATLIDNQRQIERHTVEKTTTRDNAREFIEIHAPPITQNLLNNPPHNAPPEAVAAYNDFVNKHTNEINRAKADYKNAINNLEQLHKTLGGDREFRILTENNQPITNDFVIELACHFADPESLADSTRTPVTNDGFYRLSFSPDDGPGHVVGIQVDHQRGHRFMDPNTGEFHTNDILSLANLATEHANKMGYKDQYKNYTLTYYPGNSQGGQSS